MTLYTYPETDSIIQVMAEEMSRYGYEIDHHAAQAIANLLDECMEVDDEGGTAINFLDALAQGARAAVEWLETELGEA
ncbi:hypothetical protein [Corynebacterium minutissimum]|uniref:Uncharacterized protein n=1 Tax=Corynebacterium minutissimum TaxID=38301 RepID=A0A376GU58_9CORY|nr:hypothetical protein [Corynebacterium minutissimum]QRP60844.1 hypothetical protein I6J26_11970 [Corynebacterium minutissimum]STC77397.1 Uncharacterised protein [Corynebacterium minutissimum]STD79113.1 Uncharacterised protein [Corynebacterium minutissimum]